MFTVCFKRKGRADILNKCLGLALREENRELMGRYGILKFSSDNNVLDLPLDVRFG